jgi:lipopolysaccharide transport system ATP-binding protein
MGNPSVRAEHLSKKYLIGHQQPRYKTMRDVLPRAMAAPFRRAMRLLRGEAYGATVMTETFWALQDISFEVEQGEVVGIIGCNGAGKSTLLKVLSRITEPTGGFAEIRGRVSSLLEVGTGFHPELTGRDNIFLNGAILGMKRAEITAKFDEIVVFSGVEKFIDTPVKHYSSGMYLRLAFAVAAHLQPDILIVDEVLAVGDAQFQKKCLNKMEDVSRHGRTILFVSHNLQAITRLCNRTILLDDGRVVEDGPSHEVVGAYLKAGLGVCASQEWPDLDEAPGNDIVRLRAVRVRADNGQVSDAIDIRRPFEIEMDYQVLKSGYVLIPEFGLDNQDGVRVFITMDCDPDWRQRPRSPGLYSSRVSIPGNYLAEGTIIVRADISTIMPQMFHVEESDVVAFQVIDKMEGDSARGEYAGKMPGVVRPLLKWNTTFDNNGRGRGRGGI